jgi:hypothetical protein
MATPECVQALVTQAAAAVSPSTQSLMRVAVALAQDINRLPNLKGRERLELVQRVLREALAVPAVKERIPADAMAALQETVTTIIPETLTLVVGASRGEFSLKRPSAGCVAAVAALFCRTVAVAAGSNSQIGRLAAQAASVVPPAAVETTDGTLTVRSPELTQPKSGDVQ